MVQVDVFWSYALGSGFALGAWRQLRKQKVENELRKWRLGWKEKPDLGGPASEGDAETAGPAQLSYRNHMQFRQLVKELRKGGMETGKAGAQNLKELRKLAMAWLRENNDAFNNEYFLKNLLFLSLLFVPSGAVLLWSNPNWETMQVGRYETIPQWLVGIFTTTNITQGILGFYNTYRSVMKGKYYQAALHAVLSYAGFFFILANGWDNQGYRRFFSKNREAFDDWKWTNVFGWAFSDVVAILLTYGGVFLPLMYYWIIDWLLKGQDMEKGIEEPADFFDRLPEATSLFADLNLSVFGLSFGSAVLATVLIHRFGWVWGMAGYTAFLAALLNKWGVGPALCKRIMGVDSLQGTPIEEEVLKAIEAEKKSLAPVS
jgi:hypothetical protein